MRIKKGRQTLTGREMEPEARTRLKDAISRSGYTAKELSIELGFAPTYLSRLCTGNIQEPSPSRLQVICEKLNIEMSYILTGKDVPEKRERLLNELASAPDSLIADVAEFVRTHGLVKR